MGIALDLVAVHVRAGVAFIGVADDELLVGDGFAQEFPLVAGQKPAPPRPRSFAAFTCSITASGFSSISVL